MWVLVHVCTFLYVRPHARLYVRRDFFAGQFSHKSALMVAVRGGVRDHASARILLMLCRDNPQGQE